MGNLHPQTQAKSHERFSKSNLVLHSTGQGKVHSKSGCLAGTSMDPGAGISSSYL